MYANSVETFSDVAFNHKVFRDRWLKLASIFCISRNASLSLLSAHLIPTSLLFIAPDVTIQFAQANHVFFENSIVTVNIVYDVLPENLTIRYNVTQSGQTAIGE